MTALRPLARIAARWEMRRLGLSPSATVGLTEDTLTVTFLPLIEELLASEELQDIVLRRFALRLVESVSQEHA
jgi:hypothetical protein